MRALRGISSYRHSCMRTFLRLLGFLRPYRAGVDRVARARGLAMVATVAIPWLTGRAIDEIGSRRPRRAAGARGGHRHRRRAAARCSASRGGSSPAASRSASSSTCATCVYGHLQPLELGFFDGQQTGQLMSRATVDLAAVRFFLGYGLIFIVQSALTILLAAVAMICAEPRARPRSRCCPCRSSWSSRSATGGARARRCRRSSSGSPS